MDLNASQSIDLPVLIRAVIGPGSSLGLRGSSVTLLSHHLLDIEPLNLLTTP